MALTARHTKLAAVAIATAVAGSLAPAASASSETLYVNPSTGYATPAPPPAETVQVNPPQGMRRSGGPPPLPSRPPARSSRPPPRRPHPNSTGPRPGSAPRPAEDWC
jgi:hypothetical protein